MPQILEVIIAMVVSAMMATAITTLALTPIKTQRQKNVYAASEAAAIAIRRCVVNNKSPFANDAAITDDNILKTCILGQDIFNPALASLDCKVNQNYSPAGTLVTVPYAIVCQQKDATGTMAGLAWQPLYTAVSLTPAAGLVTPSDFASCMSTWLQASSVSYSGLSGPTSENLAARYPTDCSGIKDPFVFTVATWNKNVPQSPCAITVKVSTSTTTTARVAFSAMGGTCNAP